MIYFYVWLINLHHYDIIQVEYLFITAKQNFHQREEKLVRLIAPIPHPH